MHFFISAQEAYEVVLPNGLNTKNDDIVCSLFQGKLIVTSSGREDLVNDYAWDKNSFFHLNIFNRGKTYNDWKNHELLFGKIGNYQEGPASYCEEDSVLYFSSTKNYGAAEGSNIKIYECKWSDLGWGEPRVMSFCDETFDYTHPCYDASQNLLVFSSNRKGGLGKMDLWFTFKLDIGWSELTNVGGMTNTTENEIFPSIFKDDIYYATNSADGLGGYDIRKALRSQQWKSYVALGAPINSNADDLSICFLSEDKGFFSSNRNGGMGGDDIYVFQRKPSPEEKHQYKAELYCNGNPLSGAGVIVTNELKEVVIEQKSDSAGVLNIEPLQLNRFYRMQLTGVDPSLYTSTVLYILDKSGKRVKELRFNINGFIELELLDLNYADLQLLRFEDQSLLTIDLEGQVYENKAGDIGRGEPITILDEKGDPIAIAYTNESGKFKFNKLKPQDEYVFKLSAESEAQQVLLFDKGEKITLPVLNAEVNYQRINQSDAIALVNEFDEIIYVSPRDIFIINRIYYEYNSSKLTSEANTQLDQLQIILAKNTHIQVELKSHTDSRGGDDFNLILSKKRSDAAVGYLSKSGIDKKRFKSVGMGETQLLNECEDGVTCSDPEHSINRRTEIRLIKSQ